MHGLLTDTGYEEEIALETRSVNEGIRRYDELVNQAVERGDGASLRAAERLLAMWWPAMLDAVRGELRAAKSSSRQSRGPGAAMADPVLLQLSAEKLACITMHAVLSQLLRYPHGATMLRVAKEVGDQVLAEIHCEIGKDRGDESWRSLERRCRRIDVSRVKRWAKESLEDSVWERKVVLAVGSRLTWLLVGVAVIPVDEQDEPAPAILHRRVKIGQSIVGQLVLTPVAKQLIQDGHDIRSMLRPRYQPMLVPPLPWTDTKDGGYLKLRVPLVIRATKTQRAAMEAADLASVHQAVNAISATPLSVNERVLDVMRELVRRGEVVAGLPPHDDVEFPPKPDGYKTDAEVTRDYKARCKRVFKENRVRAGQRLEVHLRLDMASRFAGRRFWVPHNLDARGRAYPIPPFLHAQHNDLSRGLLLAADERPLDDDARYWLGVHAASLWGLDKAPFEERIQWSIDHLAEIREVADDPLSARWWTEADEPWQFLAACLALTDDSIGRRMLVHQDGSCNGLQHLSAMAGDWGCGELVNLIPGSAPQSVYKAVLASVIEKVREAVRSGHELAGAVLPLLTADDGVKVVKQPIMTAVYGVTRIGARDQVEARLLERGMDDRLARRAASWLADTVLSSLGDRAAGASELMDWIRRCAREVSLAGHLLEWTSPMGMPVVQSYRQRQAVTIQTRFQSLTFHAADLDHMPVALHKQTNGSVPNVIHSIDAAHQAAVAMRMREEGLAFCGVHDSFWTHAADVDRMRVVIGEEFRRLHEAHWPTQLAAQWAERYPDVTLPPCPFEPDQQWRDLIDATQRSTYLFH